MPLFTAHEKLKRKRIGRTGICPLLYRPHHRHLATGASGEPWSATSIQSTGDPLADMHEDMAAEQKARLTYDNILRLVKDPDVCDPIRFLRERELVHYQRFGESLRLLQDDLNKKNFYAYNPDFDKQFCK